MRQRPRRGGFDLAGRIGGGGGRGRRAKLFDSHQVQLVLLALFGEDTRHGYELMRAIETRTGGAYAPSPGVVYPTLTLLTEMGQIEETGAPGSKKTYRITQDGRDRLAEHAAEIEKLFARLEAIGTNAAKADSAPVRRAMHNLREVLMARLTRPGTTDDQMFDIARQIDDLAGTIERAK